MITAAEILKASIPRKYLDESTRVIRTRCCEPGCEEDRYQQPNGKLRPRCLKHHREWCKPRNARRVR